MYLRIHTVPDTQLDVRVGDTFKVIDEDEHLVAIMVGDFELAFTKEPDELGLSYETWFEVVTEVE